MPRTDGRASGRTSEFQRGPSKGQWSAGVPPRTERLRRTGRLELLGGRPSRTHASALEVATKHRIAVNDYLDFGCASGRVLRHIARSGLNLAPWDATSIVFTWNGATPICRAIAWSFRTIPFENCPFPITQWTSVGLQRLHRHRSTRDGVADGIATNSEARRAGLDHGAQ